MGHIFISYSRRDAQFVDLLRSRLENKGVQVWLDRTDIQGGSKWRSEIVRAIEGSDAILIILSRNSVQSDNVRKELDIAEGYKAQIIPVEIEQVEIPSDFKYQLAGLQRIRVGNDFEAGFSQLLDALHRTSKSFQNIKLQVSSSYSDENHKSIVGKYAPLIRDKNIYFLSEIPEKLLASVYQNFAMNALAGTELPLCLVNIRFLGASGKNGFLITDQTLYWRGTNQISGKSLPLKSVFTVEPIAYISMSGPGLKVNSKTNIIFEASARNLKLLAAMVQELARL